MVYFGENVYRQAIFVFRKGVFNRPCGVCQEYAHSRMDLPGIVPKRWYGLSKMRFDSCAVVRPVYSDRFLKCFLRSPRAIEAAAEQTQREFSIQLFSC